MNHDEVAESWKEVIALCDGLESSAAEVVNATTGRVVIFGAGAQGRVAAQYLKNQGISIRCFTDNDPAKQGTRLDDIPVIAPIDSAVASAPIILMATRLALPPIRRQLDELKLANMSFDAFFVVSNKDRISYVRNTLLNDERSKLSYDAILKTMLTGDNSYCASVMEGNQYFALPEFVQIGNDHFVDAGAYVGDTLEKFIWMTSGVFMKIYAFEPGEPQLAAMNLRVERLRREWAIIESAIICENAGLADKNKALTLHKSSVLANTTLSHDCDEEDKTVGNIYCYSLDQYLAGRPATFIKADIEGMELEMLHGAKETIQKYKPKMAISIYHIPAHLIEIAEYVNFLAPEYRMAIRHHSPIFAESVLYCWVPQPYGYSDFKTN
jgi:FkbM family methyltransferase